MKTDTTQQNIPNGWTPVKVGDIGATYSGLRSKNKSDFGHGSPFITYMNIFSNSKIDKNRFDLVNVSVGENQNKVKYGDVFFTVSSETPEEVGMSSVLLDEVDNYYLNSFCFGFRLNDFNSLVPQYARYLFRGKDFRSKIIKMAQGSTRFNLSKERVLSLGIILPPIKEQQKIAEILGTVDEDIAKTQEVIESTEKLKCGLMQQLFTRGIKHAKFKETKIGSIPDGWNLVQIKDAPIKIADGNYSAKYPRQDEFLEDGIPFVRVNNLQNQTLVKKDLKYISAEKHADLKKGHLKTNDVLITTRGKLGVIALVPSEFDDANINAQIVLLRADNKGLLSKFLMYFLISPEFQSQVFSGGSGSALQQLPVRVLENTYIPLPSPSEQQEIAEIFSSVDEKIMINKKLKDKLTLLKKGLMQDLLSGTVRTNI